MALFFFVPIAIGVMIAAGFAGWAGAAVAVLTIAALLIAGTVLARSALRNFRSVNDLVESTGRLSDGDYSVRMPPSSSAAFRPATEAFNRMAERLERSDDLRRQLLADVGHELRTPLTIIRGELEAMADGVRQVDESGFRRLLADVAAMERLLEDLTTLSTTEAGVLQLHREPIDVVELVDDLVERFAPEAAARGVALSVSPADTTSPTIEPVMDTAIEATIDPHRIGEVIGNLLANALRAVEPGGSIEVRITRAQLERRPAVAIDVVDDGAGIPADHVAAVFDRFHKGAESSGSGLGLTISRSLVHAHGGTITIASEVGVGTTISVTLPLAADLTELR